MFDFTKPDASVACIKSTFWDRCLAARRARENLRSGAYSQGDFDVFYQLTPLSAAGEKKSEDAVKCAPKQLFTGKHVTQNINK